MQANIPMRTPSVSAPSIAFLLPFAIAAITHAVFTSIGGLPAVAAPMMAASLTLYVTCVSCAAMDLHDAGLAVAGALGVTAAAMFALPFGLAGTDAAPAAWIAASDLGLVAMFAAEMVAVSAALGAPGRMAASAVMAQTALIAAVFCLPTPYAAPAFGLLLLAHARGLRSAFSRSRMLAPARIVRP